MGPSNGVLACRRPAPELLLQGVDQFNRGEYFACHETLEILWLQEKGPIRRLYQGILQVGVALLHRERGNYRGAVALMHRGMGYLEPFAPLCQGVEVARFLADASKALDAMEILGPAGADGFDPQLVPKVHLAAGNNDAAKQGS